MQLFFSNQYWLAIICLILATISNAICDAIKFSKYKNDKSLDFAWHILKYFIDRPFTFLAGIFSYETISNFILLLLSDWKYYIWHIPFDMTILFGGFIISFLMWQLIYRLMRKYLDIFTLCTSEKR